MSLVQYNQRQGILERAVIKNFISLGSVLLIRSNDANVLNCYYNLIKMRTKPTTISRSRHQNRFSLLKLLDFILQMNIIG